MSTAQAQKALPISNIFQGNAVAALDAIPDNCSDNHFMIALVDSNGSFLVAAGSAEWEELLDRLGLSCLFSLALLGNHSTPRQLEGCVPRGGSSGQDVKARQGFAFVALLLRKAAQVESQGWPYIKDISMLLFELREKGFRFRDLGLRRIPEGYYSEDVETFVGQLLSMGYATQRSPIRLEPEGAKLCDEILEVESGEQWSGV